MLIATSIVDFEQPRSLWNMWSDAEKTTFVNNVAGHLKGVTNNYIKYNQRMLHSLASNLVTT
jgi:catalase